jgi:hypothetical protein
MRTVVWALFLGMRNVRSDIRHVIVQRLNCAARASSAGVLGCGGLRGPAGAAAHAHWSIVGSGMAA